MPRFSLLHCPRKPKVLEKSMDTVEDRFVTVLNVPHFHTLLIFSRIEFRTFPPLLPYPE